MPMKWIFKKFDELTAAELYTIMRLRNWAFLRAVMRTLKMASHI